MRFQRSDLPGFLIATLAPPALMILMLASFHTWFHHGTPLLGGLGSNLGIAGGLAAIFSRFIRKWDVPLGLVGGIVLIVILVNWAQRTGHDGTAADLLKWLAIVDFLVLNVVVLWQVVIYGLLPAMDRRAERRQAAQPSA